MNALTYREKLLYWSLVLNVVILLGLGAAIMFTVLDPRLYRVAFVGSMWLSYCNYFGEIISTECFAIDTRTDERDRTLEMRGTKSSYAFLSYGIFLLILFGVSVHIDVWLFVIWMLSRIVRDATDLRWHSGHEGLWPDALRDRIRNGSRLKRRLARRRADLGLDADSEDRRL